MTVWASLYSGFEDDEPIFTGDESKGRTIVSVNVNGSAAVGVVYRPLIPFTESSHLVGGGDKADAGAGGDSGHGADVNRLQDSVNL